MIFNIDKERRKLLKTREKCKNHYKPGISIIVCTNKIKYINNIFANYDRVSYPKKEMIIILNKNNLNLNKYRKMSKLFKDIRVIQKPENISLGQCLNCGVNIAKYNYIAKVDDDDYYGKNYLIDEINSLSYSKADVVGKASFFIYYENYKKVEIMYPDGSEKYIPRIAGSTLLGKKNIFKRVKFRDVDLAEDAGFMEDCCRIGIKIYSCNKFNYLYFKHKSLNDHTWKISAESLMKITRKVGDYSNYESIVVV
ncbi:glycosyltransferase family 2 protein [Clostridium sp. CT7]|nr:glycosyltransferase family 2 protein [Clostridium sp. CT7]